MISYLNHYPPTSPRIFAADEPVTPDDNPPGPETPDMPPPDPAVPDTPMDPADIPPTIATQQAIIT